MLDSKTDNASIEISVTFWGVRGTMPVTDPACSQFGGNTSCVEVRCGEKRLILDAGTGLCNLSKTIKKSSQPIDILLSHTHIDHILGLMFLPQLYDKQSHIRVWAGHLSPESSLMDALCRLIAPPIFPVHLKTMPCQFETKDFYAGQNISEPSFEKAGIVVRTIPLNHPDRATGYRIEYHGKSVCYITDIEHVPDVFEPQLVSFLQGADLLIYDSTYDDADFEQFKGWGHSTWQYASKLAEKAGVKQLSLFHHDPSSDDKTLNNRVNSLKLNGKDINVSHEGLAIIL